jgi:hypothetical protein
LYAALVEFAFDDLVTKQRENAAPQKQWSRIPIPIDTRRATPIIDAFLGQRTQLADFAKL